MSAPVEPEQPSEEPRVLVAYFSATGNTERVAKFASQFEDEFVKAVIGHSQQAEATDRKLKEKELKALQDPR